MGTILPTREALIAAYQKGCVCGKVGIVGGRCSKCSLQRTSTRNGLHDPNSLKPEAGTSSREYKNKRKFNHTILDYYGCKVTMENW